MHKSNVSTVLVLFSYLMGDSFEGLTHDIFTFVECFNLLESYPVKRGYFWCIIVKSWKNLQIILTGLRLLLLEVMTNTSWKHLCQFVGLLKTLLCAIAEIESIVLLLIANNNYILPESCVFCRAHLTVFPNSLLCNVSNQCNHNWIG